MTIGEIYTLQTYADRMIEQGQQLEIMGRNLHNELLTAVGVHHVDRGPGFNCWTYDGTNDYFPDADSAVRAKLEAP